MDPEDRVITGFHCTAKVWLGYTLGILKCVEGIMLWSCEKMLAPCDSKKIPIHQKSHHMSYIELYASPEATGPCKELLFFFLTFKLIMH